MTPGQLARRVMGSHFTVVGGLYRRIFVDMPKIVDWLSNQIPEGARILDVGGGDGYVINLILESRPDVVVTMTDIAADIGSFVEERHRQRLTLLPEIEINKVDGCFDILTLADVVHHVPIAGRATFLASIAQAAVRTGCSAVLVKDIQPEGLRAQLALLSDHYITGDRGVSFLRADEMALPGFIKTKTEMADYPNYCVRFELDAER